MENKESILKLLYSDNIINWQLVRTMIGFDSMFDILFDELKTDKCTTINRYWGWLKDGVNRNNKRVAIIKEEFDYWNEDSEYAGVTNRKVKVIGGFKMGITQRDTLESYFSEIQFNQIQYVLNIKGGLETCRIPIYNILKEVI